MPPIRQTLFEGCMFGVHHSRDINPNNNEFILHTHEELYELVLFLNGDAEFHAEGGLYKLKPYDMVITRPGELHRIQCFSPKPYERNVLYISREYFRQEKYAAFADVFEKRALGEKNLIEADIVRDNLLDSFNRLYKYSHEGQYIVAEAVLVEFLYLLNISKRAASRAFTRDKRVVSVIKYINDNLNEPLRLEQLAEMVFIDKYHLCRIFKKSTGYTLNGYINYKRLLLVKELHEQGQSLLEASTNAGFNNYSHFYRMYVKQNGASPKNM